ncbi:MAG TPA: HAMP domain-containing sensor histidine kinase [Arenimonas sp.]|uniref:sensor histidine kinase n=1 Tax=Arenimonas sp. TaxID=1872635 RepID=UPI002B8F713E|nr:HAMP domain-containing sensor histidine kinase [Arenimonas sp.]HMB57341.1 HAMP domain-containing sensor histidine kinase [Arenimonas sp.]
MQSSRGATLNRLVWTFGFGLLLAFAVVGAISMLAFDRLVERDTHRNVQVEHAGLLEIYRAGGRTELSDTIDDRVNEPTNWDSVYLLADKTGRVLAGHAEELPAPLWKKRGWVRFPWRKNEDTDEVLAFVQDLPNGDLLMTGHVTGEQQHLRELVVRLGATSLCLLAALTALLGWLMRRGVDLALEAPLDTVDRVAAGHMRERVPERGGDDGFARLDRTLNRMLDRIHDLVGGIQFSTDAIAHDLRTPLMRLKTRLEQARLASRDAATQTQVDAAISEADQLISTFNSLLRLAKIESKDSHPLDAIALDEVLFDAVEMWQAVAETRGQRLHTQIAPASIAGDRDLLFQLLSNLLDNAIKYGGDDSEIAVALSVQDGEVLLAISDQGPGIASDQRERVFDRFVRLESHRGTPGTGLGLSVVRAIAIHHGADLRLDSAQPGLRVLLRFPAI